MYGAMPKAAFYRTKSSAQAAVASARNRRAGMARHAEMAPARRQAGRHDKCLRAGNGIGPLAKKASNRTVRRMSRFDGCACAGAMTIHPRHAGCARCSKWQGEAGLAGALYGWPRECRLIV